MDYSIQIANLRKLSIEVLTKPRDSARQNLAMLISTTAEAQITALLNDNDAMQKAADLAYKMVEKTFSRYAKELMEECLGPMDKSTREKFLTAGYCANLVRDYSTLETLEAAAAKIANDHMNAIPSWEKLLFG